MDAKQQQIAKSALQLFIQKGFEHTSLQDILDSANISKGTFYNYFASKNECVIRIIQQSFAEIRQEVENNLRGRLRQDPAIFKNQLVTYLTQIHRYHLYDLIRSIRRGQNQDLRKLIFEEEKKDIGWMAGRLAETMGEDIRVYSHEAMMLYYGMLQTVMISHRVLKRPIDFQRVVQITWRYLELIVMEMMQSKQSLFSNLDEEMIMKRQIVQELRAMKSQASDNDKVLIEGLAEELERKDLRRQIVQALYDSLTPGLLETSRNVHAYMTKVISDGK